ncbi:MAG: hypothetical protein HY737_08605 [Candidatus Omnitrophica bacterium]|nr:hypothetical protein [Candidatus Omnitrophota bacterium]
METLTKKTTILFPPKIYRQLERVAKQQGTSVAHLVRQAAIRQYLLPDRAARVAAVEAIAAMRLPVSDWQSMERETIDGALGER